MTEACRHRQPGQSPARLVARQTGVPSIDDRKIKTPLKKNLSDAGVRIQLLNLVVSSGVVRIWGVVATPEEQVAARVAAECAPE
jgi:hypothetical protein